MLNGAELRLAPGDVPPPVVALVERMLLADPATRPTVAEVHATLMGLRSGTPTVGRTPRPTRAPSPGRAPLRLGPSGPAAAPAPAAAAGPSPDPAPARSASRGSALRGKGLRIVADAVRPAPDAPSPGRGRALLGKLIGKLEERGR